MKHILKIGLMAGLAAACIFSSCKKDDEEPPKKEEKPVVNDTTPTVDTTQQVPDTIDIADIVKIQVGTPFSKGVIDKFLPADKSTSVGVFDKPQVVLNVPLNTDSVINWLSVFRITVSEFTLTKSDGTKVDGNFSNSNDNLICYFNMQEPYENGASYKAFVKVRFEQKVGKDWQIIKDENGNDYVEEQTTEFTAGNRQSTFDPNHILYAYPADRQYAFLAKETDEAYMILDFDYTFLFNEYKAKGYEQKIRITPFGGETTTVDFTYKTVTNGVGCAEIDYSINQLNLLNNEIYHLAIVNIAKDSSETDASVPYEIYAIDFRTSYYNTISEKMDNAIIGGIVMWALYPYVNLLKANWLLGDGDSKNEPFDDYDYNKDEPSRSIIHVDLDYDNCEWYKKYMAPLLYENEDVLSIVGNYTPPVDVHYLYGASGNILDDYEVATGKSRRRSRWMTMNWQGQEAMDKDYQKVRDILFNYSQKSPVRKGVEEFLKTNNIPSTTTGDYPMILKYVLPGKNIVTSTLKINMVYK